MFRTTPEPLEVGVQRLLGQLDDLERLLDALEREVLRLGRQQRVVGGDDGVDRQQAERGRAVDEDQVVAALGLAQRALERHLAAHLAAQDELRLGQAEVGGQHVAVDRVDRLGLAGQHVGDRRVGVGRDVEVVATGCPAGRGRRRARRGRCGGRRRSGSAPWWSSRCRPSGRGRRWSSPCECATIDTSGGRPLTASANPPQSRRKPGMAGPPGLPRGPSSPPSSRALPVGALADAGAEPPRGARAPSARSSRCSAGRSGRS